MPVPGPFAHFSAPGASIRAAGSRLTDRVQAIESVEQAVAASHRGAEGDVLGMLLAPLSAAVDPVRQRAARLARSAVVGSGAVTLFAGEVEHFDTGVDGLNQRWAEGAANDFGVATPTVAGDASPQQVEQAQSSHTAAVGVARQALLAELRREYQTLEGNLDDGATTAAAVLDAGPDDEAAMLTLVLAGALPPGLAAAYGPQGSRPDLDDILRRYQTEVDEGGVEEWPSDWLLKRLTSTRLTVTATEAELLDDLGLLALRDMSDMREGAFGTADDRFPSDDRNDDHNDAFRHTYWNALMARRFGTDWAKAYATAHEGLPGNPAVREAMDLYNNEVGRMIQEANPEADEEELADLVQQAVEDGEVLVIDADGNLAWSDTVHEGGTGDAGQHPDEGGDGDLDDPDGDADPDSHNDGGTGS